MATETQTRQVAKLTRENEQLRAILAEMDKLGDEQIAVGQSMAVLRLQQELDTIRDRCTELEKTNSELEDALGQERQRIQDLTDTNEDLTHSKEVLTRDNKCYEEERVILKKEYVDLQDKMNAAFMQASIYQQDFNQERKDRETAHDLKEETRLACEQKLHAKELECLDLTKENEVLRQEYTELQRSFEASTEEAKKGQKGKRSWRGKVSKEDHLEAMAGLEDKVRTKDREIESIKEQLDDAKQELGLKKKEFETVLINQMGSFEQQMGVLRKEVESTKKAAAEAEELRVSTMDELSATRKELSDVRQELDKRKCGVDQLQIENKALRKTNAEDKQTIRKLKSTLAQLQRDHSGEDGSLFLIHKAHPEVCLKTGAQNRGDIKNHASQVNTTTHSEAIDISQSGHQPFSGNRGQSGRSRAHTHQDGSALPDLSSVLPSTSLPFNLRQIAPSVPDRESVTVEGDVSAGVAYQPNHTDRSCTTPNHDSIPPKTPQNTCKSRQSLSEATARTLISPTQSLPMSQYVNVPDIDAHLYMNLLEDEENPPNSDDSEASGGDSQENRSPAFSDTKQRSYVNMADISAAIDKSKQTDSPDVVQQLPSDNAESPAIPVTGENTYANLHNYVNLTSDFTEELSKSLNMTHSSYHTHSVQPGTNGPVPVPTPRKLKPKPQ